MLIIAYIIVHDQFCHRHLLNAVSIGDLCDHLRRHLVASVGQ